MKRIELAFSHFGLPVSANRLINDCLESGNDICSRADNQGQIPQFEPADGKTTWHLLNSVVQQITPDRKPVFCEWGSGLGQATLLASLIGLPATGIEIEEELVEIARDLSLEHAIPATFIHGSIYPPDNPAPLIDYTEIDLFFAYPWPGEIARMIELFKQVAGNGAILVCYHGGRNFRVLQR